MSRCMQGWLAVVVLGITLMSTTNASADAERNIWSFDEVNGNKLLNTSPKDVQLKATAYDPGSSTAPVRPAVTHFVYWVVNTDTDSHQLWHRSYTWGNNNPWSTSTQIPLGFGLFNLARFVFPVTHTPLFLSAAVNSVDGKLGVVFGWRVIDQVAPLVTTYASYVERDPAMSWGTVLDITPRLGELEEFGVEKSKLRTFRASLAFKSNGEASVVIGAGERNLVGAALGWIKYIEPNTGTTLDVVPVLMLPIISEETPWIKIGGVSLKFDNDDNAHVAFSARNWTGLIATDEAFIHYAFLNAMGTTTPSCGTVGTMVFDCPVIIENIPSILSSTPGPGLVRLALDNSSPQIPHVAYEVWREDEPFLFGDAFKQIRYSEQANSGSPTDLVFENAPTKGAILSELLIDSENVLERQVQILAYGSNLFNLDADLTMLFYKKSGVEWILDAGIGGTRSTISIPGGGINSATGRPVVAALDLIGSQDDLKVSHGDNVYLNITLQACLQQDPYIPGLCLPASDGRDLNDIPVPFVPTVIIRDPVNIIIYNGPIVDAPGLLFNLNNWKVPVVVTATNNGPLTQTYTLEVINPGEGWQITDMPGAPLIFPFEFARGEVVSIVFDLEPVCQTCTVVGGGIGGCGAASLYVGAVVLDSFGNALLPLIPALFALGVWAVVRRRKRTS